MHCVLAPRLGVLGERLRLLGRLLGREAAREPVEASEAKKSRKQRETPHRRGAKKSREPPCKEKGNEGGEAALHLCVDDNASDIASSERYLPARSTHEGKGGEAGGAKLTIPA